MANYDYRIGPLEWDTSEEGSCWRAPADAVGMVDLGRESDFGSPGSDRSMCVFAVPAGTKISNDTWPLLATGDMREIAVTSLMQDAWESQTGYRPSGDKLVDLIFNHLTNGSDPDWGDACKPIMPTVRGNLDLHFGGHSLVKRERFRFGVHPHTARVEALLQRDFRRLFEAADQGNLKDRDHHRRVLDYWIDKYRIDRKQRGQWERLLPPDLRRHVAGPLKHETTVSDDFNRANQQLGASENWTEVNGDWEIRSNAVQIRTEGGFLGTFCARYESDLSSDDQDSQITFVGSGGDDFHAIGATTRFATATQTYYTMAGRQSSAGSAISAVDKFVNGVRTNLVSTTNGSEAITVGVVIRSRSDGSTISGYVNSVQELTVTDTSITGNLRAGVCGKEFGIGDDFQATDLAPGGGAVWKSRSRRAILAR